MSELDRMSEEAYENKKAYNREYRLEYKKRYKLRQFACDMDNEDFEKIKEILSKYNMTRKDLVMYGYNKLKEEKGE